MALGDMAFIIGAIGIFIFICLITVRYANTSSRINEKTGRYEAGIERYKEQLQKLRAEREEMAPKVDAIIEQMMALRSERDKLQMQYEDMVASPVDRDMVIKSRHTR